MIKPIHGIRLGKDDLAEVILDAARLVLVDQHSKEAISQGNLGVGHVTTCENVTPVYWIEFTPLN